jgi:hypothetical protein
MEVTDKVTCFYPNQPDNVFITCASFEDRCLGVPRRLSEDYRFDKGFLFAYEDPNEQREQHLRMMGQILNPRGSLQEIRTTENEPLPAIAELAAKLRGLRLHPNDSIITIDVTTFTKRHLLLLLKAIDDLRLWSILRIYYTEPKDYITDLYLPMSMGIRTISPITGFISHTSLSRPTLLVILLGYEGDRANAIYENIDPNEVFLIIPKPAYHAEWEGRTEAMNKQLIRIIGEDRIRHVHSQDPVLVAGKLEEILRPYSLDEWRCSIAPLGTKPQALGTYLFWRRNRGKFSIIYAQPLRHNERFFSTGVGRTLLLATPGE